MVEASKVYYCNKGCCKIEMCDYHFNFSHHNRGRKERKAGVVIYDPNEERVLVVQSRGQLWGPAKGTVEDFRGETIKDCAIRELKEETGIEIIPSEFLNSVKIENTSIYFYAEMKTNNVTIIRHYNNDNSIDLEKSDISGIGWIKLECLHDLVRNGNISLTRHACLAFKKFFGRYFFNSKFVLVKKRGRA